MSHANSNLPDRCAVAGCTSFVAGHETARMCWSHEGSFIDDAAYHRGMAEERERICKILDDKARICDEEVAGGSSMSQTAGFTARMFRSLAAQLRAEVVGRYQCIKCCVRHDGEPMRAQLVKRGKDPSKIKFCAACFWEALVNLGDEAEANLPPEGITTP